MADKLEIPQFTTSAVTSGSVVFIILYYSFFL